MASTQEMHGDPEPGLRTPDSPSAPSGRARPGLQALFLFTASVSAGVLFGLPEPLADAIGILGLLAMLFMALPRHEQTSAWQHRRIIAVNAAIALAGVTALLLLPTGATQALALAVVLLGVHVIRVKLSQSDPWLPATGLALLLLSVLLVLLDTFGWMDYALGRSAAAVSSLASGIGNRTVTLGATHAGLLLTAFFVLYVCAIARFSARTSAMRTLAKTAAVCGALIVIDVVFVVLWARISGERAVQASGLLQPFSDGYDMRLLLFVLLLIPVSVYRPALRVDAESDLFTRKGLRVAVPLALVLAVSSVLVGFDGLATTPDNNVLIYDSIPGEARVDVPVFGSYSLENTGMFGLLPGYLRSRGYSVRVTKQLSEADLAWAGTLVTFNLRSKLDAATDREVRAFVEEGGSLLVAGDHTGREEIRDPSNALLEPYGITLNFDSAIPFRDAWFNGLETRAHPTLAAARDRGTYVVIGASLTVTPPARTIVAGRDGYSDPGDEQNLPQGFLGNMNWDRGEHVGDLPLVAESSAGSGRVLVFGDTTTFQNAPLPHSYQFVDDVFEWLSTAPSAKSVRALHAAAALALLACAVALYVLAGTATAILALPIGAMLGALLLAGAFAGALGPTGQAPDVPISPYAVIDMSHFESADQWRSSNSVDGLTVNLQRNGYVCLLMPEFDEELVRGADVVVAPTPLEPFTATELTVLDDCMKDGGLLIITAGSERPAGSSGLLGHYGFGLGTAPLGPATSRWEEQAVRFWSAWPVKILDRSNAKVLAAVWDYPVAVYRPEGEGGVLVVGDGSFLLNKNLEDNTTYSEPNILFLKKFLETFGGERKPDA